jgi:tRNA(fMet)-specific endonuclease VapC
VARLILDTGVVVAAARGRLGDAAFSELDDIAIPADAVAEHLTGVELDGDPARRAAQSFFLEELLAVVPVVDHTLAVAEHHAVLLAHARRSGRPRGAHDLLIAASAPASGRVLLTTDLLAHVEDLPGVECRLVSSWVTDGRRMSPATAGLPTAQRQ